MFDLIASLVDNSGHHPPLFIILCRFISNNKPTIAFRLCIAQFSALDLLGIYHGHYLNAPAATLLNTPELDEHRDEDHHDEEEHDVNQYHQQLYHSYQHRRVRVGKLRRLLGSYVFDTSCLLYQMAALMTVTLSGSDDAA